MNWIIVIILVVIAYNCGKSNKKEDIFYIGSNKDKYDKAKRGILLPKRSFFQFKWNKNEKPAAKE